ncbi:MAG: 2-succinyl-5-enolpyruvyl-6-hydroxy-3-cyclohexene-1-carboxylic-acid synthase [SAR324 cluster bacterium]|nr:2-succinyl-5-enolpyruvyl-6-hydroxy-3-cyclohexene-1-carboxylic-acid synthase [SAR324 cluster bacterium]MDP7629611.1 2-succinyl-5-enolpyruvyl-6-hydroxy-3-cyclohexene-1-carboxylic-acid synthase [SAR324 cluster bacterium]
MTPPSAIWNPRWGEWLVEELVRNGCTTFCVSPGSRSTPLTLAAAHHPQAECRIGIDERGSAYFALGHARATGRPAVFICTSGTAVANALPAVIEASVEHLPLLILSADRPPEFQDTGANQTIDQTKLFGSHVRWFFDPGCPGPEFPPEALLSMVDQAVHCTRHPVPGPVHLNLPFREPFFPAGELPGKKPPSVEPAPPEAWQHEAQPWVRHIQPRRILDDSASVELHQTPPKRGILSVGRIPKEARPSVQALAQRLGWPIFADITSGLRLGSCANRITHFDQLLLDGLPSATWQADAIWHLGFPPISKRWLGFWEQTPAPQMVWIADHSERHDPVQRFRQRIESDLGLFCKTLKSALPSPSLDSRWLQQWQDADAQVAKRMETHFGVNVAGSIPSELHVAHWITRQIAPEHALFLGNSLPVRMVDFYGSGSGPEVPVVANRGASGIDGLISSTLGYAQGAQQSVTLLIGDLSLLHDLNSLSGLAQADPPVIVMVLNNHGGGIFSFLPVAQQEDLFERCFGTPHELDFCHAAKLFGLDYEAPDSLQLLNRVYKAAVARKRSALIEVVTDRKANVREQQRWQEQLCSNFTH